MSLFRHRRCLTVGLSVAGRVCGGGWVGLGGVGDGAKGSVDCCAC